MYRLTLFGIPLRAWFLFGGIFLAALVLPSVGSGIFASPDETAVAVSLEQIAQTGSAAVREPFAKELPWLHPRSYLASGEALVPVGFLGWPWWLAQFRRVLPLGVVVWFASLFAASGTIPWYLLLRKRFGPSAACWGTILAWTFPPVLLYLNRSFFSHLPQYTAALWGVWLLSSVIPACVHLSKRAVLQVCAGLLIGISLSLRPVEAIWLLPLILWACALGANVQWRKQLLVGLGCILGAFPLFLVQAHTYGSWFQVGYWIQANSDPAAVSIPQLASVTRSTWLYAFAPYGLHPRNMLWNVRSFWGSFLWPWMVVLVFVGVGVGVLQKQQSRMSSSLALLARVRAWVVLHKYGVMIVGFACAWLLLIYGSGLYTDHVRVGAVTVANSFLRYTLPFGFLFAWWMAWVFSHLPVQSSKLQGVFSVVALVLVGMGVYTAFFRDEESILVTRQELTRYAAIRSAADAAFKPGDVVLSERSDKIFFPELRAVTPLPTTEQIQSFSVTASSTGLGLFSRPLSFSERDAWRKIGYDVTELQTFGRERLYRLTPFLR